MDAEAIARVMQGHPHKRTLAPDRITALMRFPSNGSSIRATIYMRYAVYRRLRDDGLIEGGTGRATLTPLGLSVRAILLRDQGDK